MPHIHELYDFTVSAYILHPTEPKIALHLHKKLGMWMQMGGHVELHEDPLEALSHELKEEAGLSKEDYEILQTTDRPIPRGSKSLPIPFHFEVHEFSNGHKHIDLEYVVRSKVSRLKPDQNESQQIDWYTIEQIRELEQSSKTFSGLLDICEWVAKKYL